MTDWTMKRLDALPVNTAVEFTLPPGLESGDPEFDEILAQLRANERGAA